MMSYSVTPDLLLNAVSTSHRQRGSEEEEEVGGVYHELEDEEDDYAEIPADDDITDDLITHHPSTAAAATGENVNVTTEDIYLLCSSLCYSLFPLFMMVYFITMTPSSCFGSNRQKLLLFRFSPKLLNCI